MGRDECEEVERAPVGPVKILEDDDQRLDRAQFAQSAEDRLEQERLSPAIALGILLSPPSAALGRLREEIARSRPARRSISFGKVAERVRPRTERQGALIEVDRASDDDPRPPFGSEQGELADEPAFPDA